MTATGVRSHEIGLLVVALAPDSQPFGGGTLCLAAPLLRTAAQLANGASAATDCTGTYSFHLDQAWLADHAIAPGTPLWVQWVSRDGGFAAPGNVGLSDALSFSVCP